ncbi:unnamed protein product [Effrenium voratum]|nr:unnamed protein product [Effrenium voratum]
MSAMDPALCGLSPPMRVGLVAQVIRQEPDLGGTLMEGINPQQRFVVSPSIQEIGLITLFNAEITAAAPLPRLLLDARSGWVRHSRPTFGDFFQLRELCAGIGGFSQGANFVGIKTVACLDHSALACAALRLQGHYTIQGHRRPGSLINKARTLWTCFWPRALHGIVTCRLGDQHIKQLRSAAVAALQLKCAGGNPILRLTLEFQCMADPGYYQIATTLRDFRRLCHKQPAHVNEWAHFMRQYDGRLLPGPFSKLIEVCSSLGWTITSVPIIQDHDGVNFNLLMCATNELDIRLNDAWAQHIAGQVQHRKSMNGLRGLDLACTTRRRSKYNSLQARLVAAIWDGSFRAVCYHAKYDLTKDAQCPRCHVTDDYRHQVAVCPRFHSCRGEDQWAADIWDTLPECISQHLLIPRNPMLADIKKALGDLPDRSTEFHLLPNDQVAWPPDIS